MNRRDVRALVIGGHAVAFHAKPRFTKDVDVLIEASEENAERLLVALDDYGFGGLGLSIEDFTKPGQTVQLGIAPNRVDISTSISGVTFEEAWRGRVRGSFGTQSVYYLGKPELIRNKRLVARPQDLADLDVLEEPGDPQVP